jgi:hypothetical protein
MEYYSAIKKNEIIPFAEKWMELETIMLNQINQTEKDKYHKFKCLLFSKLIRSPFIVGS